MVLFEWGVVRFERGTGAFEQEDEFTGENEEGTELGSSVGIFAVQHGVNAKRIVRFLRESDAIIANTQSEFS